MHTRIMGVVVLIACFTTTSVTLAQKPWQRFRDLLPQRQRTPTAPALTETRIAQGLKEALRLGTTRAIARTGKPDGFFGHPRIRITLPQKLRPLERGLRFAGYGDRLDAFVLSMNRAAEKAVPFAKQIFWEAITAMTFADARRILRGGETAATTFFKEKTSTKLYEAFRPTVDETLERIGTVRKYHNLLAYAQRLPFLNVESLDLGDYVTRKTLDGLFFILAEEERRIRTDPAARVTALLRQVFGR